jgi:hypothetical protein
VDSSIVGTSLTVAVTSSTPVLELEVASTSTSISVPVTCCPLRGCLTSTEHSHFAPASRSKSRFRNLAISSAAIRAGACSRAAFALSVWPVVQNGGSTRDSSV